MKKLISVLVYNDEVDYIDIPKEYEVISNLLNFISVNDLVYEDLDNDEDVFTDSYLYLAEQYEVMAKRMFDNISLTLEGFLTDLPDNFYEKFDLKEDEVKIVDICRFYSSYK